MRPPIAKFVYMVLMLEFRAQELSQVLRWEYSIISIVLDNLYSAPREPTEALCLLYVGLLLVLYKLYALKIRYTHNKFIISN